MFTALTSRFTTFVHEQKTSVAFGVMILFWTLYEGIVSFVTPILITQNGYTNTEMGLLYSSSSLFGVLFDFLLMYFVRNTHYRRMLLIALLIASGYSVLLWTASTFLVFLLCMALWGLYTNLFNFGFGDLSGRFNDYLQNTKNVSLLAVFKSTGFIMAPLFTDALLNSSHASPQIFAVMFILLGVIAFWAATRVAKRDERVKDTAEIMQPISPLRAMSSWKSVTFKLLPVLLFVLLLYVNDAIFWTIGPLLSQNYPQIPNFGGWFLTVNMLPGVLMFSLAPFFVQRLGKKRTAFWTFLISLVVIIPILYVNQPILILCLVFLSSLIGYTAYPAINSAFADYLEESKNSDCTIMGIKDVFVNLGYIIGPFLVGFLSDRVGNMNAIVAISVLMSLVTGIIILVTPHSISFKDM